MRPNQLWLCSLLEGLPGGLFIIWLPLYSAYVRKRAWFDLEVLPNDRRDTHTQTHTWHLEWFHKHDSRACGLRTALTTLRAFWFSETLTAKVYWPSGPGQALFSLAVPNWWWLCWVRWTALVPCDWLMVLHLCLKAFEPLKNHKQTICFPLGPLPKQWTPRSILSGPFPLRCAPTPFFRKQKVVWTSHLISN